jgi:histidyl-tRNA synthetase
MADKTDKLKARLPRGLTDRGAAELAATREMIEKIRTVYELYGFEPVETPAIEYTDALGKFLPDQDRPNEGVFSFQDDDEQWLSLRYDLTAPLARYVAENFDALPKPYRSYRFGWVFRNEKPGPGRFRQFMQFDADTVGSASAAADAEMCMMAADTMEALGIPRGSYVVKVWSRKLLDGIMDAVPELSDAPEKRMTVLRSIDARDRIGIEGVQQRLSKGGRTDASGDVTKGAGLENSANNFITTASSYMPITGEKIFIYSSNDLLPQTIVEEMERIDAERPTFDFSAYENKLRGYLKEKPLPDSSKNGLEELRKIKSIVEICDYSDRIKIDPTVVRGLEYYTGPVFEVELTFSTDGKDGSPRFGSVGGGGRYDGLVSRFRGEPAPATGFSIGVSRLAAALQHIGKLDAKAEPGPVVVTVFDRDRLADYQNMVARLRAAKIRAELYLGNPRNLGNQLKYADKRNSPCVVIQGGDEKAKGEVTIKDLIVGAELAKLEKGREEHLQKQAQAQIAVSEDKLVEAVREVLARHARAAR